MPIQLELPSNPTVSASTASSVVQHAARGAPLADHYHPSRVLRHSHRRVDDYHALLQSAGLQVRVVRTGGGYKDQPYTADELLERAAELGKQLRQLTADRDEYMAILHDERAARIEVERAEGSHHAQLQKLEAERVAVMDMLRDAASWRAAATDELRHHEERQAELQALVAKHVAETEAWRTACQAAKLALAEIQAELDTSRSVGSSGQERIAALQQGAVLNLVATSRARQPPSSRPSGTADAAPCQLRHAVQCCPRPRTLSAQRAHPPCPTGPTSCGRACH